MVKTTEQTMKLIVFGCSFTDYRWPTWADIIAEDLGCEYENWGLGGGGNQAIARRILYRSTWGFESTDWIMVQWSSLHREDRFQNGKWISQGSVSLAQHYGAEFIEKYWDWDNDIINTAQARITSELILDKKLKYQSAMTWHDPDPDFLSKYNEITSYWRERITPCDQIPSYTKPFNKKLDDGHPDPLWWLKFVEEKIYPKFNFVIKPSTREKVLLTQEKIQGLVDLGIKSIELDTLMLCQDLGWRFNRRPVGYFPNNSYKKVLM